MASPLPPAPGAVPVHHHPSWHNPFDLHPSPGLARRRNRQAWSVVRVRGGSAGRSPVGADSSWCVMGSPAWGAGARSRRRSVGLHQRQVLVDDDVALGPQGMADPPQPHLANVEDARGGPNDSLHPVDECRVDGVHEPGEDLPGGLAEHGEGGDGCDQADDRVGQAEPEGDPPAPMSTTRLVRPSVRACRPSAISAAEHPATRPGSGTGHQLMAAEPDHRGGRDQCPGRERCPRRRRRSPHRSLGRPRRGLTQPGAAPGGQDGRSTSGSGGHAGRSDDRPMRVSGPRSPRRWDRGRPSANLHRFPAAPSMCGAHSPWRRQPPPTPQVPGGG